MRLQVVLPRVEPTEIVLPSTCPFEDCQGTGFRFLQEVTKPLLDVAHQGGVSAHRYQCLQCGRTFRAYPRGVTQAQVSQRVKGLAVLLRLLGLSYGAVSQVLEALGIYMCKSRVHDTFQEVGASVSGLNGGAVLQGVHILPLGGEAIIVEYDGQWLSLELMLTAKDGLVLTIDGLPQAEAEILKERVETIARSGGIELLVRDVNELEAADNELGQSTICEGLTGRVRLGRYAAKSSRSTFKTPPPFLRAD